MSDLPGFSLDDCRACSGTGTVLARRSPRGPWVTVGCVACKGKGRVDPRTELPPRTVGMPRRRGRKYRATHTEQGVERTHKAEPEPGSSANR